MVDLPPIGDPGNVLEIPTPPATGNVLEIPSQVGTALDIIGTTTAVVGDLSQVSIVIAEGTWSVALTNPFTAAIMVLFQLLEWLGIIPDPIEALFGLFTGRPHEEATVQVIQRLQHSPNAAARLWGIELSKMLTNMGIVISDSSQFGQMMLGRSYHQFVVNMQWQGVSLARAQQIALFALSRAAQAGAPLEPELQKVMNPQLSLVGPQTMLDRLQEGLQIGEKNGLTGLKLQHFAENYLYKHEVVFNLQKSLWIDKSIIPGGGQGGGGGTGILPGDGGGQPAIQPGDDELGDLGNQLYKCLDQIASAIQGQNPQPGSTGDCCAQVVSAISLVTAQLANIANQIALSATRDPVAVNVDTTPIATALEGLKASLDLLPGNADANTSRLVEAINNSSGTDVSQIVEALNRPENAPTLPSSPVETAKAIAQWVADNAGLDPAATQLITS